MRLDKYLKVSRLIKRRTVANEACDNERVTVNGRVQRASYDVKVGDVISIRGGGTQRGGKRGQGRGCRHVPRSGGSAGQTVIMQGVPSYDTVKTVWEGALFQCLTI